MPDRAVSDHPDVQVQLDRLAQVSLPRDVLGFERIRTLLDRLGNPERALPPVVHVAGTNGKGSVCAYLRAAIEAAGFSAHAYTSPHLVRLNERIRVAGQLIGDAALAALLREAVDAVGGAEITFFEATTAAAFLAFARTPADACIVEVGIGGRLDATNVVPSPCVCGITQLGIDHSLYLGDTLAEIAAEKAGIAKPGIPLVTQAYPDEAAQAIAKTAAAAAAPWLRRGRDWDVKVADGALRYEDGEGSMELPVPRLAGSHQVMNAGLAVAMLRHQTALAIPEPAFASTMKNADWPARLQLLAPGPIHDLLPQGAELWLDGAHNPAAAEAVASFFRPRAASGQPFHIIVGMLSDRSPAGILKPLAGLRPFIHAIPVPAREFHSPAILAAAAHALGLAAATAGGVEDSLISIARHADHAQPPIVLILGSLYLAGEVLRKNDQVPS